MDAITEAGQAVLADVNQPPGYLADEVLSRVRDISGNQLAPLVRKIDADGVYPESVMQAYGDAGAYGLHLPTGAGPDIKTSIQAMSIAGEYCLSTAFCMWCQNAITWYVFNSDNTGLHETLGAKLATGQVLGGTGLSNPMKTFFGIEQLNLKGSPVSGGYAISGRLPWVSNLGPGHQMAVVFEVPEQQNKRVMAVVAFDSPGLKAVETDDFVALGGTRTYGLGFQQVFVSQESVLADPIDDYLPRIRAGFILLQAGMAFGMIRSCAELMLKMRKPLGHINQYLDVQPEQILEELEQMEAAVFKLAQTPYDPGKDYFIEVVRTRLQAGEAAVNAAHHAMLHSGARGYVGNGVAQRRLREAYFCAIVTPATKQLRKMLSDLGATA